MLRRRPLPLRSAFSDRIGGLLAKKEDLLELLLTASQELPAAVCLPYSFLICVRSGFILFLGLVTLTSSRLRLPE